MSNNKLLNETHKVDELTQGDLVAASLSAINKILVEKGIASVDEIKDAFTQALADRGTVLKERASEV